MESRELQYAVREYLKNLEAKRLLAKSRQKLRTLQGYMDVDKEAGREAAYADALREFKDLFGGLVGIVP